MLGLRGLFKKYHKAFQNPKLKPWMILGTVLYLISPVDIIPEFIPLIGFVDDIMLLVMFIIELFTGQKVDSNFTKHRSDFQAKNKDTKNANSRIVDAEFKTKK